MFTTSQDLIIHLIHHCDMNTAMKRQPQVGPRKYKRRRKLKPHELELISNRVDEDVLSDEEPKRRKEKKIKRETPKSNLEKDYESVFESFESAVQTINSIVNSKPPKTSEKRKKFKEATMTNMRPKMIHTQKTRVPIDIQSDGKTRHKTKTLITRTTHTQQEHVLRSQTQGERNRPRTKNVSYHVLQPEKLPVATFDDNEHHLGIKPDPDAIEESLRDQQQKENSFETIETEIPDIASEETVLAQVENQEGGSSIRVTKNNDLNNSLTPGRHIIGPGNKVIRIVKGGMIVRNEKKETKEFKIDIPIKQEIIEPSPLHELAELSMQHAQNQFRCEMCSATFTDRSQLLMHVPIHI